MMTEITASMLPRPVRLLSRSKIPLLLAAAVVLGLMLAHPLRAQDHLMLTANPERRPGLESFLGPQGYAVVPLRRASGPHLEVVARINGVTGHFLVDTGAQITVVHAGSLSKFRLSAVKTGVRVYGAVGGPGEQIQAALASRLQLGPCEATPFLLGVSDLTALNQGKSGRAPEHYDGIIGADVLQTFGFIIDCAGLQLLVWPPNNGRAKPGGDGGARGFLRGRNYGEIAMKRASISDFEVPANVNGSKALWLVDTGAAITLLDRKLSKRAGVALHRTPYTVGGAGGGRQHIEIGIVNDLRFSSVQVRSAYVAVSNISMRNAALQETGKPAIDGYLGADFLRQRGAVIDCGQMRLYLKN